MSFLTTINTSNNDVKWASLSNQLFTHSSEGISKVSNIGYAALKNTRNVGINLFNHVQEKIIATPLSPFIEKVNSLGIDLEKIFNIGGCLPWLGILSGSLRIVFGKTQAIGGIALTIFSEIGLGVSNLSKVDPNLLPKWQTLSKFGAELTIHGCLNVIRGTGEVLIGTYSFGLGNVVLIIPNLVSERNFGPYFSYGSLTNHLEDLKEVPCENPSSPSL